MPVSGFKVKFMLQLVVFLDFLQTLEVNREDFRFFGELRVKELYKLEILDLLSFALFILMSLCLLLFIITWSSNFCLFMNLRVFFRRDTVWISSWSSRSTSRQCWVIIELNIWVRLRKDGMSLNIFGSLFSCLDVIVLIQSLVWKFGLFLLERGQNFIRKICWDINFRL